MKAQYFFVVLTPEEGAWFYGTKYQGPTNVKGLRFSYWRMNCASEVIGKVKTVSWNHAAPANHEGQLQTALGEGYRVLSQWETLRACERSPRFDLGESVICYTDMNRVGKVVDIRWSAGKEFQHAYRLKYSFGDESHWINENTLLPAR